jgi:hypothetical protein
MTEDWHSHETVGSRQWSSSRHTPATTGRIRTMATHGWNWERTVPPSRPTEGDLPGALEQGVALDLSQKPG